jgi:hypothetical protein
VLARLLSAGVEQDERLTRTNVSAVTAGNPSLISILLERAIQLV